MLQNLHTHTNFCDGKNSAEEMVLEAIKKGLKSIGFSGHSPINIPNDFCMTYVNFPLYVAEITRLKEKYSKEIEIFLGIENEYLDFFYDENLEYIISSVHMVLKNDIISDVDNTKEIMLNFINEQYNANVLEYIKDYYELVKKASKKGDILGHFDLITKFNKDNDIFDEYSKEYQEIASNALLECIKNDIIIEINSGAIQRGYQNKPYPAPYFFDLLYKNNAKIIITSDAHIKDGIDCFYNESVDLLKKAGIKNQMILTKSGFEEIKL